jgi:hypothetical protein
MVKLTPTLWFSWNSKIGASQIDILSLSQSWSKITRICHRLHKKTIWFYFFHPPIPVSSCAPSSLLNRIVPSIHVLCHGKHNGEEQPHWVDAAEARLPRLVVIQHLGRWWWWLGRRGGCDECGRRCRRQRRREEAAGRRAWREAGVQAQIS